MPHDLFDFLFSNSYYTEGAVNIYSVNLITDNIVAYFKINGNYLNFTTRVSRYNYIENPNASNVLTHEVGHNFNLKHTFYDGPPNLPGSSIEHVARVGEPFYNADTRGDNIIDTYATTKYYNITNCVYDDTLVDPVNRPYRLSSTNIKFYELCSSTV
jgi:hypothetical protein